MDLEHADEGRLRAVQLPAALIGDHPDRDEIVALENQRGIGVAERLSLLYPLGKRVERRRRHGRHPFRILSHCASATRAACGVVEIFFGHGRVKPSLGHFLVASIPILLP